MLTKMQFYSFIEGYNRYIITDWAPLLNTAAPSTRVPQTAALLDTMSGSDSVRIIAILQDANRYPALTDIARA